MEGQVNLFKSAFNSGLLSPLLDSRVNVEKYQSGCRTLQNFVPLTHGPITRRAGMEYLGESYHTERSRLIGFSFSTTTNFMIEMTPVGFRFWTNGALVVAAGTVGHPYTVDQLREVQLVQINDVLYMTHPSHPVGKLVRRSDTNWTYEVVAWKYPALRDENATDTTVTASGTTGNIQLTSSADVFTEENVEGYFEISHRRELSFVEMKYSSNGNFSANQTNGVRILGSYNLTTYGSWETTLHLEILNEENGEWEIERSWSGRNDRNINFTGLNEEEKTMRLRHTGGDQASSSQNVRFLLEAADARVRGIVKITGYSGPQQVDAEVINDLQSTDATVLWTEGAWSERRGHPNSVTFHDQRLVFGGNQSEPQKVWGSRTSDFENFQRGTLATNSFAYQLAATESHLIRWIVSQDVLIIGTAGEEWTIGSTGGDDTGIDATNVRAKRRTRHGSKAIGAILADDVAVFVQRNGRKVRQFRYNDSTQSYTGTDLTVLAENVTEGEIKEMVYQNQKDPVLWAVTGDGRLLGMTLENSQNVFAWHEHITDGTVESVGLIYGDGSDEVWVIVNRTIQGVTKRYMERLNVDGMARDYSDIDDLVYVDSAVKNETPSDTTVSCAHLEGKEVSIVVDGAYVGSQVVSGGQVSLPSGIVTRAIVGLPYTSVVKSMKPEVALQDGTARNRNFLVKEVWLNVYKSLGGGVRSDSTMPTAKPSYREASMPMNTPIPLFTGEKRVVPEAKTSDTLEVEVITDDPFPFTLTSITSKAEINDV